MSEPLTGIDIRVLGALIEKERTTPEYYPMSLNALINACNQSSNRDPVVNYDESIVSGSIEALRQKGLVRSIKGIDARVPKYLHRVSDVMGLNKREIAVLGVLMLRGVQTVGELRTRTARMETFEDLADVEAVLEGLIIREMAVRLPRQPGQKEVRYAHLLAGEVTVEMAQQIGRDETSVKSRSPRSGDADRMASLEAAMEELKGEVADLRAQLLEFRGQFE